MRKSTSSTYKKYKAPDGYLTVTEFKKTLSISNSTYYKYVALGEIHQVSILGKMLVPKSEVTRLLGKGTSKVSSK